MISVMLFKGFAKDANSTRQPVSGSGAVGTPFQCEIFEPCSVLAPVIKLRYPGTDLQSQGYNYAHIPIWGRYYWITDQVFQEGFWFVHLAVDVLASWKSEIGSSAQYILRSASQYNENLIDTIYAPDGGRGQEAQFTNNPFSSSLANGSFVIAYSSSAPVAGSNAYAVFTSSQLIIFLSQLMGSGDYLNLDTTDLDSNVAKAILNPIQYIQSVKWYPFTITGGSSSSSMFFGWWLLTAAHSDLLISDTFRRTFSFSLPIRKHPQAATRGNYLNLEPYSQYRLYLPVIGYMDLPAALLYEFNGLNVSYEVDLLSGIAHVTIEAYESGGDRSITVAQTDCNLSIEVPVAQIYRDVIGSASAGVSGIAGAIGQALTGDIAGGLSTLVSGGVEAVTKAATPIPSFMGSFGNLGAFHAPPQLELLFQTITPDASPMFGRPLCDMAVIGTLSGYIMCGRAHVAIAGATKQEIDEIESYMNGGFRYE